MGLYTLHCLDAGAPELAIESSFLLFHRCRDRSMRYNEPIRKRSWYINFTIFLKVKVILINCNN